MGKLSIFATRLRSASFGRMLWHIKTIHEETGRSQPILFADMLWCAARYGIGYLEYHVFGFAKNRGKKRRTFMTMNHNVALCRSLNDKECIPILDDKIQFLEHYRKYVGREWLDLRKSDFSELESFCKHKGVVFAKLIDECGGCGTEKITYSEQIDFPALYKRLLDGRQYLIEEGIVQHKDMNRLCESSVNTIRVVTLLCNGKAKVAYSLLRMGNGQGNVDNISSGGMYTLVSPDGKLTFPAFCDKTGLFYDEHPVTKTKFKNYELPYFKEAMKLCCEAALVEQRLGYVGWDVAITPNGPILVEGNNMPGYDMAQNAAFHPDGQGFLPLFEKLLGHPITKG